MAVCDFVMDQAAFRQWLACEEDDGVPVDLKHSVALAMCQCTGKQQVYIRNYFLDGMSVYQIADRYGVNASTISRTINRGLKNMFQYLRFTSPRFYNLNFEKLDLRVRRGCQ